MMTTTAKPPFRASRYTTGAVVLHWAIALLVALQLASGFAMTDLMGRSAAQFDVYQLHKSFGITVLLLTVARIVWRLFNPPPPEPASVGRWESFLANVVQFAFYALLLLVPLAGWVVISAATVQIDTVLFFREWLPFPHLPWLSDLDAPLRSLVEEASEETHGILAYSMLALIGLHVAGALKHQFADGAFLSRMGFSARGDGPRRAYGLVPTVLVTAIVAAVLIGAGTIARHETPASAADTPEPAAAASPASPAASDAVAGASGAPASAVAWTIDPAASSLTYKVAYSGADIAGGFRRFDADIRFSPDDLAGSSIDVTIDTGSAFIDSSEVSLQNLAGPDGFANREFGTAQFTADTIRADGEAYVADGTLTIRGTALPQSLRFTVAIDGAGATAAGTMRVDRLGYDIGRKSDASGKWLGLEVTVDFALSATRRDTAGAALPDAGAASEPGEAPPWQVLAEESRLGFAFRFDGKDVTGTLGPVTAQVHFAEDNLGGSSIAATVALDGAVVTTGGVSADQIKGAQGLDAGAHPTARFQSETIEYGAEGGFVARGPLTVRGVTHEARLPFTLEPRGDGLVVARGTLSLDRRAYGFAQELGTGGPAVGSSVEIDITLVARPPAGTP